MGTEKYPKENDYNQYLSEHSGFSNAFTGVEDTNYYFEVGHEYLEGALDRFAQFFIAPLFSDSCTERELKAVDSGKHTSKKKEKHEHTLGHLTLWTQFALSLYLFIFFFFIYLCYRPF